MSQPLPITDGAEREYLQLLARMQLAPRLIGKVDLSGVVQQTLWEADQAQPPASELGRLPWLRRLLANNLRDEIRKLTAARRDVRRETSLESALEQSSSRLEVWAIQLSSPSQRLMRAEELNRLVSALAELPDDQRTAIERHHLQGESLAVVAERLGRTKEATAALLYRGLKRLRQRLDATAGA